jgi:hypothetical protein
MAAHVGVMAGGFAVKKIGGSIPVVAAAQLGLRIAKSFFKHKKDDNPFWNAFGKADVAGK